MTTKILAPSPTRESRQYHLPEIHRQAILAQSDSALLHAQIERQRLEFERCYGNAFGIDATEQG